MAAAQSSDNDDAKGKEKKKNGKSSGIGVGICHKGQTIRVPDAGIAGHLDHGDARGRCLEPRCPGFPGYTPDPVTVARPMCEGGRSGTFGYSVRRVAQTFVAQQTGGVVSIDLTLQNAFSQQIVPETVDTLDTREMNDAGVPTRTVLGPVDVSVGSNPGHPLVLTGTFDCPGGMTSGTTYAMAITTDRADRLALATSRDSCLERMYSDVHADGTFRQAGTTDLLFSTCMVV